MYDSPSFGSVFVTVCKVIAALVLAVVIVAVIAFNIWYLLI